MSCAHKFQDEVYMSNISVLDPNSPSTSTSVSSLFASATAEEKTYSEDAVTLSDEALELLDELRYKENQTYILTENQRLFDQVSKALPATESFDDMLNWLSSLGEDDAVFTLGSVDDDLNRNVYEKDPDKYAELWSNMYNHFTELMDTLGLSGDTTMQREVMSNESVSTELLYRFTSSFSDDTNSLLSYFNITV